jgi:hypothetical protein
MGPHDEPLRERLMAQQERLPAEKLARYRAEVDALLEQLRRRRWWIDAVRAVLTTLGAIVLFPLAALFGAMSLYGMVGNGPEAAWCPGTAGLACLAGAVVLMRWFFRRREDDLLLEVKRLQAQGLELEEELRRREEGR